jgi:hypothetical protein
LARQNHFVEEQLDRVEHVTEFLRQLLLVSLVRLQEIAERRVRLSADSSLVSLLA